MNHLLSRYRRATEEAKLAQQLARIATDTNQDAPPIIGRHTPGDATRLRGIPVVGVPGGHGGAIRGTRPTDAIRSRP